MRCAVPSGRDVISNSDHNTRLVRTSQPHFIKKAMNFVIYRKALIIKAILMYRTHMRVEGSQLPSTGRKGAGYAKVLPT